MDKPVKKDRFRWNLSIFHWCVDTNQRGYKSVRIHKATPIHARMYLAEKAKIFFPGGDTHMDKKKMSKKLTMARKIFKEHLQKKKKKFKKSEKNNGPRRNVRGFN